MRIPNSVTRYWTKAAKDCYDRDMICEGCIYSQIMETPCVMDSSVMSLLEKLGKPPETLNLLGPNKRNEEK